MTETQSQGLLVDWGTSNARAWLVDGDGSVLASSRSESGITRVKDGKFADAFKALTDDLTAVPVPTLMSGMIGSRQGWIEAPYLKCPVSLPDLANQLIAVPEAPHIRIVPGVHQQTPDGHNDVMRGEEVQIAGALEISALEISSGADRQLLCLPGTHSKWALVEEGRLTGFATSMTGEVYAALADHTILKALLPASDDASDISASGFERGLIRASDDGGVLHHLFGVRAEGLFDTIPPGDLRGYLSGILIGHEVRDMLARYFASDQIIVVGQKKLAGHYIQAITRLGHAAAAIDPEQATIAGLKQILKSSETARQ